MTVQCCKCKRVRANGKWRHVTGGLDEPVSHTYCPRCEERLRVEMFSSLASQCPLVGALKLDELLIRTASS
ncbi:MAG: hypothetical protein JXR94_13675 [Candidatus Hydrogenedentes bacterium]|nr:hypothetical protein [Candidatus Hydrogenedentota bacterium]